MFFFKNVAWHTENAFSVVIKVVSETPLTWLLVAHLYFAKTLRIGASVWQKLHCLDLKGILKTHSMHKLVAKHFFPTGYIAGFVWLFCVLRSCLWGKASELLCSHFASAASLRSSWTRLLENTVPAELSQM